MTRKIILPEEEVSQFVLQLRNILTSSRFNVKTDLDILMKKKSESPLDPFTTFNTLLALGFDSSDICYQLLSLGVDDYLETIIDDKDSILPPFQVFVKEINRREVYIKIKIRDASMNKIFCVSFHFARFSAAGKKPYQ